MANVPLPSSGMLLFLPALSQAKANEVGTAGAALWAQLPFSFFPS